MTCTTYLSLRPRLQVLDELQQRRIGQAIEHRQKVTDHQILQANASVQAQFALARAQPVQQKKTFRDVSVCTGSHVDLTQRNPSRLVISAGTFLTAAVRGSTGFPGRSGYITHTEPFQYKTSCLVCVKIFHLASRGTRHRRLRYVTLICWYSRGTPGPPHMRRQH